MTTGYLGKDENGNRVEISAKERRQQTYILGNTGTGKSVLLENLIMQDIRDGIGVAVIDPKGDLVDRVIERLPEKRISDVILLDVATIDTVFGLNLYETHTNDIRDVQTRVEQVMHIMELLYDIQRTNPLIAQTLRNASYTLIANRLSFTELPHLLTNPGYRRKLMQNVTNQQVRLYWQQFEQKNKTDRDREIEATRNKFDEMLQPLTFAIVGQLTSTINMTEIMDARPGKILLVKLDAQMRYVTSLIGSLLVAQMLNATYGRQTIIQEKRKAFNIYVDEFSYAATPDFQNLFDQARGFGVTLTVAHQTRTQLSVDHPKLARSVLQAGNLIVLQVTGDDAKEVCNNFNAEPEEAWEEELEEEWVEVLEEEWHERVEEEVTDGNEAVQVTKRDIVTHLLTHGHPNADVTEFVTEYLQYFKKHEHIDKDVAQMYRDYNISPQVARMANMKITDGTMRYGKDTYSFDATIPQKMLERLNDLMYRAMMGESYTSVLEGICEYAGDFLGFRNYFDVGIAQSNAEKQAIENDILTRRTTYGEAEGKLKAAENSFKEKGIRLIAQRKSLSFDRAAELYDQEYHRYHSFYRSLQMMLFGLTVEPVMTESGLHQPRTRKQITYLTHPAKTLTHPRKVISHPQRTYADIQGEIANRLRSQPYLTAWVRKPSGEHHITIERSNDGLPRVVFMQRVADIQENNLRDGYVRIRADVEKEINERIQYPEEPPEQTQGAKPKPKPKPSAPQGNAADLPEPPNFIPPMPQRKRKQVE